MCIENLQPDVHNSINDTYVRIMARNRPEEEDFGGAGNDDSRDGANNAGGRVASNENSAAYRQMDGDGRGDNLLNGPGNQ